MVPSEATKQIKASRTRVLRILNFGLLCFVLMGFGMSESLYAPFFPIEALRKGVDPTTGGFIFATFSFVMFLGSLISGPLVQKLGVLFMIASGTLLAGCSVIFFGFLDRSPPGTPYISLCFILRFVEGAGASLYNTAVFGIAAMMFPDSISTVYAALETAVSFGMMTGPSFGGWLYRLGGFAIPFYTVGVLLLFFGMSSVVFLKFTYKFLSLPESQRKTVTSSDMNEQELEDSLDSQVKKVHVPVSQQVKVFCSSLDVWLHMTIMLVATLVLQFPEPVLALHLNAMGFQDPFHIGLVFLLSAFVYIVFSLIFGKLADLRPSSVPLMMFIGAAAFTFGLIIIGPSPPIREKFGNSVAITSTGMVFLTIGSSIVIASWPVAFNAVVSRLKVDSKSLETMSWIAGIYNACWYLGSFIGAPIAGGLYDLMGFEWAATSMAAFGFMMCILSAMVIFRESKQRKMESMNKPSSHPTEITLLPESDYL